MNNEITPIDWLKNNLTAEDRLYAVLANSTLKEYYELDGGRTPHSLWQNTDYRDWREVMPFIVPLDLNSPFLAWISRTERNDWGWLGLSRRSLPDVVSSLERLVKVRLPDDKEVFFRYWDGRFLSLIMAASTQSQRQELLGGFHSVWINRRVFALPDTAAATSSAQPPLITAQQLSLIEAQHKTELWRLLKTHFVETYPKRARSLGDTQLNRFIDLMNEKITRYQISRKDQAKQFIELAAALGSHFDTDPMLRTWVEPYLTSVNDNVAALILLRQDLAPLFTKSMGKNLEIYLSRLRQLTELDPETLTQITSSETLVLHTIKLYPERVEQLPDNALLQVFHQSQATYQRLQFSQSSSRFVLLALQLFLGAGALDDPLYPWIGKIITQHPSDLEHDRIIALINYAKKRLRKEMIMLNKHLINRPAQDDTTPER